MFTLSLSSILGSLIIILFRHHSMESHAVHVYLSIQQKTQEDFYYRLLERFLCSLLSSTLPPKCSWLSLPDVLSVSSAQQDCHSLLGWLFPTPGVHQMPPQMERVIMRLCLFVSLLSEIAIMCHLCLNF